MTDNTTEMNAPTSGATVAAGPVTGPTKVMRNVRNADAVEGTPYLKVENLEVEFPTMEGPLRAVQGLSYEAYLGRTLAIVGESGSGKSVSSMAVMGLHDPRRTKMSGSIQLDGRELLGLSQSQLRQLRGDEMSMVFQDPQSSLHPFYKVGWQVAEAYRAHHKVSKSVANKRAIEMLDLVGIPNPQRRAKQYPHEFSGGMRQRAMIALALVNDPKLLFADEPTTALDVTVQAQVLDLLNEMQKEFGSAIILITHDLGVVAEVADDVMVMYAGRAVETGSAKDVLVNPRHPYTWGLLESIPSVSVENEELKPIKGSPPSLLNLPSGCSFNPRCPYQDLVGDSQCTTVLPELVRHGSESNATRCHLPDAAAVFAERVSVH